MMRIGKSGGLAVLALVAGLSAPACADQNLVIEADKSQMLTLPAAPGAVIIGNPSIADVTTHGDKLFVHGRAFGQTNLIILDQAGNQIVGFDVMVKHTTSSALALFRGTSRFSYSCAPFCEGELQPGDNRDFFDMNADAATKKMNFATGSETSEAKAPAAPQ